ncbi:MAG TPA: O-antigen ligase family protein [Methylocella sp.]|nr:O-antigen ligase family protein [Methylocella sp.]
MRARADVDRQRSPRAIDRPWGAFLHRAFLLLLAIVPFWYGSVGHVPLALAATVVVILAIALTVVTMTRDADFPIPLRVIALPALGLSAVVAWAVFQALVPAGIAANPAWRLAADTLRIDIVGRVSVAPVQTLVSATQLAASGLFFWLALQLGRDGNRAASGLRAIGLAATFYAGWGILDHSLGWNHVLVEEKDQYALYNLQGYVTGTFRNRDHFAAYCAIGLFCTVSLIWRDGSGSLEKAALGRVDAVAVLHLEAMAIAATILVCAIWLTRSRAVIGLTIVVGLLVVAIATWRATRTKSRAGAYRRGAIAFGVILVAVALILEDPLAVQRISALGEAGEEKWALYRIIAGAIMDYPLTGVGFGAFADAFPVHRTAEIGYGGSWNAAHNIYLEAIFGLGIPAAIILFLAVGCCLWRTLSGACKRRSDAAVPIAASAGTLIVLSHGVVDFSIQTPAVAFTLAALLGYGCAQSWTNEERRRWSRPTAPRFLD